MISIKPAIYNINAFDATKEQTILFTWSGNQAFANRVVIRNNTTNTIVYQATQDSMQLKHIVPPNSLTNGILYNITISVTDIKGAMSEYSNSVLFFCYTTPVFVINNLAENQIVQSSSFQVNLTYSQDEGEELQYYQIHLYNTNKNQIWSSGVKYDTNLSSTITDLDDNGVYFIRATGKTINGMELETEYIRCSVNYVMPSVYARVTLENISSEGSVKIQSNILSLECKYYNGTPSYINDDYIDLTNPNNYVCLDEEFNIRDNVTFNLKGYNFTDFSTILSLSNGEKTITVTKKKGTYTSEGDIEKTFFELIVPSSAFSHYVIRSNFIDNPLSTDILSIWLRRINNIYDLYVENLSAL